MLRSRLKAACPAHLRRLFRTLPSTPASLLIGLLLCRRQQTAVLVFLAVRLYLECLAVVLVVMAQLGLTNFHYFNGFRILTGILTVQCCLRFLLHSKEAYLLIRYIQARLLGVESGARAVMPGRALPALPVFLLVEEASTNLPTASRSCHATRQMSTSNGRF
jgi:hypothetical protein